MTFNTPDEEFAWAVGIFEAEGSFIRAGLPAYPSLQLKIAMCDEDVLRRLASTLGLNVTGPYLYSNMKTPAWRATKAGPEARATIYRMLPHLGERRAARARELLEITSHSYRVKRREGRHHGNAKKGL